MYEPHAKCHARLFNYIILPLLGVVFIMSGEAELVARQ